MASANGSSSDHEAQRTTSTRVWPDCIVATASADSAAKVPVLDRAQNATRNRASSGSFAATISK
ncbi:MAG: hypothetical protein R3F34_06585 [Planctomycetota bacterium]